MGKDLKGKEIGKGLSQRPDGRYIARAQVDGKSIVLYGWDITELKKQLIVEVDELRRSTQTVEISNDRLTLNQWFE